MNRSLCRGVGRLVLCTLVLLLAPSLGTASEAVPRWQQIFHPAANGTTGSAPLAARELADGTVLVVTQTFQTVHYNHDGTIVSLRQLALDPPRSRPGRSGVVQGPEAGLFGTLNARAVIDGFGVVVLARVAELNYYPIDTGDIEIAKFDGLTGAALWPAPIFFHAGVAQVPTGVFVDRSGGVILTSVAPGNLKHFTLKYDGHTGAVLWGPQIIDNTAFPLFTSTSSIDLVGNVIVSLPTNFPAADISTIAYSGANGSVLWGPVLYNDADAVFPLASLIDTENNYVVIGSSSTQFVTLKYNASSGALLWGPSRLPLPAGASNAAAQSVVADSLNNVFVSGQYLVPGNLRKCITQKLSGATGAALWTGTPVDGGGSNTPLRSAVAANGDVIVGAFFEVASEQSLHFWCQRGSDGTALWGPTEFGPTGPQGSDPPTLFVGSNGRIFTSEIVAPYSPDAALSSGEIDAASGIIAWGPTGAVFPHQYLTLFVDLAAGPDGNPVVTGGTRGPLLGTVTLKYDRATGVLLWGPVTYESVLSSSFPQQVVVDSNNDVFVFGSVSFADSSFADFVLKYSGSTGALLWGPTLLNGQGEPIRVALDPSGNALVLTWQPDLVVGNTHTALTKISGATGSVLWGPVIYESTPGASDLARALALDPSGNAFIVGINDQWFVLKYSNATGGLLWAVQTLQGYPNAVAADAAGDVAVTGGDIFGAINTVKYSGATGAVVWGPFAIASGQGDAVAIAPNGDVIASAEFVQSFGNSDFLTIRYKSSDGSVVWGPVLTDGEGHGNDIVNPLGLAFDAAGNVVLGGYSQTIGRNYDISLVKYAGATGATLWGPVYLGGPDNEKLAGFEVEGNSIAVGATSQGGMLTAVFDEALGIQTAIPSLPPATCGQAYSFPFVAQNGTTPYTWSLVSGGIPAGLTLSSTGNLAGAATEQGTFTFIVRVTDSSLAHVDRGFTLVVGEDRGFNEISVALLAPCQFQLSVPPPFPGNWTSYLWLPGGETTPTIDVAPIETTTYGVVVGDESGCLLHLEITFPGEALQEPSCLAPAVASITPSSGPSAGGTPVTIAGGNFEPGAQLAIGGQTVGATVVDPAQIAATTPALAPGTLNNIVVVNPDSGNAVLLRGFFADFLDVPPSNIFHDSVERLFRHGVTAGCDAGTYCPDAHTTRAQMAVFLLKSLLGASYQPPPATGGIFIDVFPGVFAADWIEDLYSRGITGGCVASPLTYCPDADVTRAQMAVFLLKTLLGAGYQPPAATGTVFGDVPANAFAAAWIEDLYHRGLTAGCSASPPLFCPDAPVTRGEMAAFLVRTFGLQ